jgi:hypothetical protein
LIEALGEGIETFSGVLEETWSDLTKDFLGGVNENTNASLARGAKVYTSQGAGSVVSYDDATNVYEVQLEEEDGGAVIKLVKGLVLPAPPVELTADMESLISPDLRVKLESFLTDEVRSGVDDTLSKVNECVPLCLRGWVMHLRLVHRGINVPFSRPPISVWCRCPPPPPCMLFAPLVLTTGSHDVGNAIHEEARALRQSLGSAELR